MPCGRSRLRLGPTARSRKAVWNSSSTRGYGDALAEIKAYSSETGIDIVYSTREVQMEKARSTEDLEALIATKYILHSDPGIDISDAVLKRLNDKFAAGGAGE